MAATTPSRVDLDTGRRGHVVPEDIRLDINGLRCSTAGSRAQRCIPTPGSTWDIPPYSGKPPPVPKPTILRKEEVLLG